MQDSALGQQKPARTASIVLQKASLAIIRQRMVLFALLCSLPMRKRAKTFLKIRISYSYCAKRSSPPVTLMPCGEKSRVSFSPHLGQRPLRSTPSFLDPTAVRGSNAFGRPQGVSRRDYDHAGLSCFFLPFGTTAA